MNDLIERLEAASAGSRELDAAVHLALYPEVAAKAIEVRGGFWKELISTTPEGGSTKRIMCPDGHYTTSLDAALALAERVLPGWCWEVRYDADGAGVQGASVWWDEGLAAPDVGGIALEGPTPALALCFAILRATTAAEAKLAGYEGPASGRSETNQSSGNPGELNPADGVWVPREPTPEMVAAFWSTFDGASDGNELRAAIQAMIAASEKTSREGER